MCEEGASNFYSEENEDDEDEEADFSEDLVSEDIIGLSAPTKEKEGRTISVKLDKAEPIGEAGGEVAMSPNQSDVGNEKGDKPSGTQSPKVAKYDTFVAAHNVLDEMPKQDLGDNPHNVDTISDSGTNRENLAAVGNYWVKKGGSKPTLQNRSLFFLFESWRRWSFSTRRVRVGLVMVSTLEAVFLFAASILIGRDFWIGLLDFGVAFQLLGNLNINGFFAEVSG
ncbi:hypothetical protein U1Q18_003323 [Sarracenia purpurea var. burkii]